ncbi:MAG TPA: spore coat associated protein CotJA [Candidatus Avidehalobacter gallistercoris]|uniref:Spore coat associated protein CotJA n=1 Tax=Candidatus Avidehalobacter gallistercoris TaxID=2840694 RepID=A0A9D1HK68_9FIRM|nr:spore coat associated protein CotJA [Candidatus Avidehalobacter gallistercoris]
MQTWQDTYRPETAFTNGTIFPELNLPYMIGSSTKPVPGNCSTSNCARGCSR